MEDSEELVAVGTASVITPAGSSPLSSFVVGFAVRDDPEN
jgi:hypothetical protein